MARPKLNKRKYTVERTDMTAGSVMNKKTKDKVAGPAGKVAGLLFAGGLAMVLSSPILGCILMGIGATMGWFLLIWMGWFPFLARKYIKYPGCVVIAAALVILALYLRGGKADVPADTNQVVVTPPSVVATAPNSPGSQVLAVGQINGDLNISRPDPNDMAEVNRKLDALLALTDKETYRLEKEHDLGFVLVAFSGEVDETRVRPHGDKVMGDWSQCRARKDDRGYLLIHLPDVVRLKGRPASITFLSADNAYMAIQAKPGAKSRDLFASGVRIRFECLKTEPIGICAAIGFAQVDTQPK